MHDIQSCFDASSPAHDLNDSLAPKQYIKSNITVYARWVISIHVTILNNFKYQLILDLLTILIYFSPRNRRKLIGMKNSKGNSLTKSLDNSPNLKRNVFHIRVNAQKMRMNYMSASTPLKI